MKKIEQSIRNLWNKFMWPNMYVQLKHQKKKKRDKEKGNYIKKKFEDIAENGIHIEIPEESEVDSYHN